MESIIKELWHGNIVPEDDCRVRSPEMKQLEGACDGLANL